MSIGEAVAAAILLAATLSAVPLLLAATGEAIGERAGVLNLGIEGVLLLAGFVAFRVTLASGSIEAGLIAAVGAGLLLGLAFGLMVTVGAAEQVIVGIGLTLAGTGLSTFLFRTTYGSEQPLLPVSGGRPFDGLADRVPVVGPALFAHHWSVYAAVLLVVAIDVGLRRSLFGLRLRAAGEAPVALDAAGVDVLRIRLLATTIAGVLYGLAGGMLVVVEVGFFRPGITAGAGFIAVALAMLGRLTPWRISVAAVLFGLLDGLGAGLQVADVPVSVEALQVLPYAGVVVALLLARRQVALPAALGRVYHRGAPRHDD